MVGSGMFSPKIKCDRFGSDCSEKNVIGSVQTGFFKICVHDRKSLKIIRTDHIYRSDRENVIGSDYDSKKMCS